MSSDLVTELDKWATAALSGAARVGPLGPTGDEGTVSRQLHLANSLADVDVLAAGPTRMVFSKRLIFRLARLFMHRQREYNHTMVGAVADLNSQVAALRARIAADGNRAAANITHVTLSLADLAEQLDQSVATARRELDGSVARAVDAALGRERAERGQSYQSLDEISRAQQGIRSSLTSLRADLDAILTQLRREPALDGQGDDEQVRGRVEAAVRNSQSREQDDFYQRFEDEMRGTGVGVAATLEPYLADLETVRALNGPVVDVGSGRGEWLELLTEAGFEAVGVDTNEAAVELSNGKGLNAVVSDAIEYLLAQPAQSVIAVTCFHIIEHLPAAAQLDLLTASLRAIKPGGLIILETPNPTNLNVGAAAFYLDPTHLRPVNPSYLAFLLSDLGFVEVSTRFLHPREHYIESDADAEDPSLVDEVMWALRGPQDFAVLGRVGEPTGLAPSPG